jgi:dihydroneopterin aldolase
MHQPSKLLEHVAGRIAKAIEKDFPKVSSIDLTLTKKNPPMGAACDGAGVEVHFKK